MENLTAIILAAGRGSRMQSTDTNKVALEVSGEPMLVRTIKILNQAGISNIVVVVGFAKESVIPLLAQDIIIAEQTEQLGTGHAVQSALSCVPINTHDVLIVYGDDSFLHTPQTFQKLYETHREKEAKITFITMQMENPSGFGRIIRDEKDEVVGIVEEKNASEEQRKITEINLGCYIIDKKYLEENIKNIAKNLVTGEYYITDIIDIIAGHNGKIAAYKLTGGNWRGVNTREDLIQAEQMVQYEN
ncbi:MAG: sugar phosphate nucleotidyltransferase [Candidatus Levybacteria bacterium]|nr:sugar phosphate nucleotidyltransferase [Candidatus Levybacteria bacterium]